MRKLIVNADDFGLTRGINKGIARGFRLGIVTSASAMVNMPCWDHAAELAKRLPGLSVGLHFNLTLGCPVTPPRSVPTLVDAQGRFHGDLKQLATADPLDITRELYNQYNRLCRSGIAPSHVDGHQGIHALDNILAVLLDFAARLGLPLRLAPHARERYKAAGAVTTGALIDQFQGRGLPGPTSSACSGSAGPKPQNSAAGRAWWMPTWKTFPLIPGSGNGSWQWYAPTPGRHSRRSTATSSSPSPSCPPAAESGGKNSRPWTEKTPGMRIL